MSDEPHAAPADAPPVAGTSPEPRPKQAHTDTSPSVTTNTGSADRPDANLNPEAPAPEGPNAGTTTTHAGRHETTAASIDEATAGTASAPTGGSGTAGANLLPGPFVAPSSYLRPVSSVAAWSRAQSSQQPTQTHATGGRQMAVRKASNPIEREQIEGLVSALLSFLRSCMRALE